MIAEREWLRAPVPRFRRLWACLPGLAPGLGSGPTRVWLLAVFIGLVIARAPGLILGPRLWAEEGALFLNHAYAHSFWQTLQAPLSGYYNLPASLGAVLGAKLLSVELAPVATLLVSGLAQLCPALVVLTAAGEALGNGWRRGAVLLLLLVVLPSHEVWLNTVNSQFHLCAACGLILAFAPGSRRAAWGWRAILAAGGLSGIASVTLCPLFAIEAWRRRERERAIQAAILAGGAAIQAATVLVGFLDKAELGLADPGRGPPALDLLAVVILIKSVIAPLAGSKIAEGAARWLRAAPDSPGWWAAAGLGLAAIAAAVTLVRPAAASARLLWAYLIVTAVCAFGWLGDKLAIVSSFNGGRYFYAPNLFLGVALLLVAFGRSSHRRRAIAAGLAVAMLVTGTIDFWGRSSHFKGPDWRTEVRRWRDGETDSIAVHPSWFAGVRPPRAGRSPSP